MERISQHEMIDHCLREIRKHPYDNIGLEHFVFMQLLNNLPTIEYNKIVDLYEFITNEKEV